MVKKLSASSGRYLGYEISGKVDMDQERIWIANLEAALEMHRSVCVLLKLYVGANWGVQTGIADIKWVFAHMSKLDRIAIVTDEKVWKWLIEVDSHFAKLVGIKERHFPCEEINQAWAWLKES